MGSVWEARRSGIETPRHNDCRDGFERDRSRIVHSSAFHRLQAKTQVLGISEGDFHRTRLTHSMEVGQLSRGLVQTLGTKHDRDQQVVDSLPSLPLIEAVAFSHDLGHPPFGHGG